MEKKKKPGNIGGTLIEGASKGAAADNGDDSIKKRMKHSLAQRRTALQSRSINVQTDTNNVGPGAKTGMKERTTHASVSKTSQTKLKSPMMKTELKSSIFSIKNDMKKPEATQTELSSAEKSAAMGNVSLGDEFSLELDNTVESDVADSMEASACNGYSHIEGLDNQSGNDIVVESAEEEELSASVHAPSNIQANAANQEQTSSDQKSEDINIESGELVSVVESCGSIQPYTSSNIEEEELTHLSPNSNSNKLTGDSPLTPSDSIQTFSIGSLGASSGGSFEHSRNSQGTSAGSIHTCSIGGRSVNITSDPFKTSIFNPSPVRAEQLAMMENDVANVTDTSCGGLTAIPDVSVRSGSHIFPSPTHHMLYASPTGKTDLSLYEVSPSGSASSSLDDLSRQLESVRLEKQESGRKMALSTSRAEKHLKMYDDVQAEERGDASNVSPASKAIATGDSSGLSTAAATSLIERNKTLVKEVRFADQTCVELSERNASMARQVRKMETDEKELKSKNDCLQQAIITASQASARAEENQKDVELRLDVERVRFESQLKAMQANLQEEKQKNIVISQKLEESINTTSHSKQMVASVSAKYEEIHQEYCEAKETISTLTQRLATVESTVELAASSAAQKYREASSEMQEELRDLQDDFDACNGALKIEKEARINAEEELFELKAWCNTLEMARGEEENQKQNADQETQSSNAQSLPPSSPESQTTKRTTASTVLAKTLRQELERGHDATERIIEAERIITLTQSKLRETENDLKLSKDEALSLRKCLRKYDKNAKLQLSLSTGGDTNLHLSNEHCDNSSVETRNSTYREVNEKLSTVRTQCQDYKRELDCIITQIQGIQTKDLSASQASVSSKSSNQSHTLLRTVKEMALVCTNVNAAAGNRVNELEARIRFLTQSMNQLNEICIDEESNISCVSVSLQMMEEGVSTPVKANQTPIEVLYLENMKTQASPTRTDASLMPPQEKTPVKIADLRRELSSAEEQLEIVREEKDSLEYALEDARSQIELLLSSAQESLLSSDGKKELLEEKSVLEESVSSLRSHIEDLEGRIEGLEEDKAYLFDDAEARVDELEGAKREIVALHEKVQEREDEMDKLSNEKNSVHDELKNFGKLHNTEIESLTNRNHQLHMNLSSANEEIQCLKETIDETFTSLREAETSRDKQHDEVVRNIDMIHSLQESLAQATDQANDLKMSFMNCNEELASCIEEKNSLQTRNEELDSTICLQQQEIDSRLNNLNSVLGEYENSKAKLYDVENAYDALHEELVKMGSQVEILSEQNDEHEKDLTRAAEVNNALQNELDDYEMNLKSVNAQLHDTKKQAEETDEASVKTISCLEIVQQDFYNFQEEVAKRNILMDSKMKKKEEELKLMMAHFSELEKNLTICEKREMEHEREHRIELNRHKKELEETKKELKLERDRCQAASENASLSECESSNKEEEIFKLQRKNESLKRKCTRMREYVQNLTSKCKEWEESYAERENTSQSFQRKYQEALSKISQLTVQMNGCNSSTSIASRERLEMFSSTGHKEC